jgi:hypothetical protein
MKVLSQRAPRPLRRALPALLAVAFAATPVLALPARPKPAAPRPPPDTLAPELVHKPLTTATESTDARVEAVLSDPSGLLEPSLLWRYPGQKNWTSVPLTPAGAPDLYVAIVAADKVIRDFEYYLEAYDNQGNGPARAGAPEAPLIVRVVPPPPPEPPEPEPVAAAPALPEAVVTPAPAETPRYAPSVLLGIGAALAACGLVAWMDATSTIEGLGPRAAAGSLSPADHAIALDASRRGFLGSALAIAGGVAAATGVGLFFLPPAAGSGGDALVAGVRSTF